MMPPLKLRALQTHETGWDPASVKVAINARLDARIVPSAASPDGARLDYAHIVVLDDFFGEDERVALLGFLTAPDWDHSRGPPADKWERATADGAGLPRSWGLKDSVLRQLAAGQPDAAMREVHSRLAKLYPDVDIAHMPSDAIQGRWMDQDIPAHAGTVVNGSVDAATAPAIQRATPQQPGKPANSRLAAVQ
ncbi:hypothetical protein WJX72_011538 [[Myrmecia] bisecta]|uniref:Uncharacterized protein n=1 Tax=[Myrmecia] bisecta TaxID=41462 RepID=A0AAW1P3V4_9CHLO